MTSKLITHAEGLTWYTPPGHMGTRNARLEEHDFCGSFEMLCGVVQPGGEAEPHQHEHEYQVLYVLHRIVSIGPGSYEALVLYSPPLPARSHTPERRRARS